MIDLSPSFLLLFYLAFDSVGLPVANVVVLTVKGLAGGDYVVGGEL